MSKDRGMTLLELLVVIAILGIFMSIAVPGVIRSFRLISQVKQTTARYPNARMALERMSETIRHTYPMAQFSGAPFIGKSDSVEASGIMLPYDELSFPILDTSYSHLRSAHKISYKLNLEPGEGEALGALIEKRSFIGAAENAGIEETIAEKVVGLDFRYLDDSLVPAEWTDEWPVSPEEETSRVPSAVKITILVLGEISPEPRSFTTVVNIPAQ